MGDFIADVSQGVKEVEDQSSKLETKNNLKIRYMFMASLSPIVLDGVTWI